MTPSQRADQSDNLRRLRMAEQRNPVDAAFYSLVSLSDAERDELIDRYNDLWEGRHRGAKLTCETWGAS